MLAELGQDEQDPDAVPLTWQTGSGTRSCAPEARELWVRACRRVSVEGGWRVFGHDTPGGIVPPSLTRPRGFGC